MQMQKIEEHRAAMRVRLEAALGVRLGFTMDEAAAIAGISKKGFYNSNIGFKVGGKRRVLVVGGVVLFAVLLISIVQGAFNMVTYIPDQVLGWLGGHIGDKLGRQREAKHEGKFQSAVLAGKAAVKL